MTSVMKKAEEVPPGKDAHRGQACHGRACSPSLSGVQVATWAQGRRAPCWASTGNHETVLASLSGAGEQRWPVPVSAGGCGAAVLP